MIKITDIKFNAIRSRGSGGQNVNKVSTGIHLRFDIHQSSLTDECKQTLLNCNDARLTKDGVIIIKADKFRTQNKNRTDAINRLTLFVEKNLIKQSIRKPNKIPRGVIEKRLKNKTQRSEVKKMRKKIRF